MQTERLMLDMKKIMAYSGSQKTTIARIVLRRHKPRYVRKSVLFAVTRSGDNKNNVNKKEHAD